MLRYEDLMLPQVLVENLGQKGGRSRPARLWPGGPRRGKAGLRAPGFGVSFAPERDIPGPEALGFLVLGAGLRGLVPVPARLT